MYKCIHVPWSHFKRNNVSGSGGKTKETTHVQTTVPEI